MAKDSYKIPADLNTSYSDTEIVLSSKDGMSMRPMPVKVLLGYVASVLLLMYILLKTFIGQSPWYIMVPFIIVWVALTILLMSFDKTKRMNASLIPTVSRYMSKAHRHVSTRTSSNATPFYQICGINKIRDNGMIEWSDGTYGFMYRVTGSASILLFEGDRNAIIDRVDMFYRKLDTSIEVGYITMKEAQKVYRQIANLKKLYDKLDTTDPDLLACAEEQYKVLADYVGKSFRSIHQYMYLKANNEESLMQAKNVLQSEVENSSYMIKQCVALYREDIHEVLRAVYQQQVFFDPRDDAPQKKTAAKADAKTDAKSDAKSDKKHKNKKSLKQ